MRFWVMTKKEENMTWRWVFKSKVQGSRILGLTTSIRVIKIQVQMISTRSWTSAIRSNKNNRKNFTESSMDTFIVNNKISKKIFTTNKVQIPFKVTGKPCVKKNTKNNSIKNEILIKILQIKILQIKDLQKMISMPSKINSKTFSPTNR